MVDELRMWYCGEILQDSFETFKRFNDVKLLSAKSTFKIIHLGGYVQRIDFLKLLYNDDEKYK